ncbi:scarecrow-like protein 14 [Impatiens glandulifera]|uniref:scarecrow-like protein 14 n=1 Tax=Impatiens glandulifera TaxID=253017 RepID=UPI001FB06A7F|nr:scarecrow-like protein 14 [Impatiens glandulifera]
MDDDILGDGPDSHHFFNQSSSGALSCKNGSSEADSFMFINQVLMEDDDDLENIRTFMIQESTLDATEKSLYNVLYNNSIDFPSDEALSYHDADDDLGELRSENLSSYDVEPWLVDLFNNAMSLRDPSSSSLSSMDLHGKSQSKISTKNGNIPTRKRKKEAVDLRALLLECMEYLLMKSDHQEAKHLLSQIQQLSSPSGNGSQRLAHYFSIGIEAHLASKNLLNNNLSLFFDFDRLKAYKKWFAALPFLKTSNFVAEEKIVEVADKAGTIHLIHFGDNIGLHLAPIIQRLSKRPGGPPKLRITWIDLYNEGGPNQGVKQTELLLEKFCEKLNIPVECDGIALNWRTLSIDDLKMKGDEVSVVMCFFSMHYVLDDTILEDDSPRDNVLNLIKRINPDIFIHGTINGTYNSPFLISRFREALFYYSIYFDIYDTIFPIDDPDRTLYEETAGSQILNVIACEGLKRVDRPDTYRQWNSRMLRKGFIQLPLNRQIVEKVATLVRTNYHKDFFVDESCQCMVQGWKTRVLIAISFWKLA